MTDEQRILELEFNLPQPYFFLHTLFIILFPRSLTNSIAILLASEGNTPCSISFFLVNQDTLITKDNKGNEERTSINYKDLVNWVIRTLPNGAYHRLFLYTMLSADAV